MYLLTCTATTTAISTADVLTVDNSIMRIIGSCVISGD